MNHNSRVDRCINELKAILNSPNKQLLIEETLYSHAKQNKTDIPFNDRGFSFSHGLSDFQLQAMANNVSKSFKEKTLGEYLQYLVDSKGIEKDSDVYKKACVSREDWHKLIRDKRKSPSKKYLFAIAVALELTLSEVIELLERAGYTFIPSNSFDSIFVLIFNYKIYDPFRIDKLLVDEFQMPPLFASV